MKSVVRWSAFRTVAVILAAMILLFSCSDDGDKRQAVKDDFGEPDEIIKSEYGGIKSELYIYARRDINRAYEFQKTVSGCGGSGKWYVYRMYYADYLGYELYMPPVIVHEPITSAPEGQKIVVNAVVTDDFEVISVALFYRTVGQEEFEMDRMTGGDEDTFSTSIPGDLVSAEGIEYYIEAYDVEHDTRLPEKGYYTINVGASDEPVAKSAAETSGRPAPPPSIIHLPEASTSPSPVGP